MEALSLVFPGASMLTSAVTAERYSLNCISKRVCTSTFPLNIFFLFLNLKVRVLDQPHSCLLISLIGWELLNLKMLKYEEIDIFPLLEKSLSPGFVNNSSIIIFRVHTFSILT